MTLAISSLVRGPDFKKATFTVCLATLSVFTFLFTASSSISCINSRTRELRLQCLSLQSSATITSG